ncbi:MAG: FkbM family methyltransferase [Rhodospirillales bacterium]
MSDPRTWSPPETLEETAKRLLVPGALYIRYLYRKELRRGEPEIRLIPSLADPARLALDIGANKGVYTFALLRHCRRVHAFEPNPKLFRVLKRWAKGKAELYDTALSDTTGEADLLVPRSPKGYSNQGASLSAIKVAGDHGIARVTTARLDDLGLHDVGFMKIDVEGAEMAVLNGARETIARDKPVMMIELEAGHTGRPLPDLIAEVESHGYHGKALVGDALTPLSEIDLARHHDPANRADYLFNFIFMPA